MESSRIYSTGGYRGARVNCVNLLPHRVISDRQARVRAPPPLETPVNLLHVVGNIGGLPGHRRSSLSPLGRKTDVSNYGEVKSRRPAEGTRFTYAARTESLYGQALPGMCRPKGLRYGLPELRSDKPFPHPSPAWAASVDFSRERE